MSVHRRRERTEESSPRPHRHRFSLETDRRAERVLTSSGAPGPGPALLSLQRTVGNRAVTTMIRPTSPTAISRQGGGGRTPGPGTGYDGLIGGPENVPRNLNAAQVEKVRKFRTWLETTFAAKRQGNWAKRAAISAAHYPGTALEKATLYAEYQRQMMQVDRNWGAKVRIAKDGAHVFVAARLEKTFIVAPDGRTYAGTTKELSKVDGRYVVDYRHPGLRPIEGSAGTASKPTQPAPTPKPPTVAPGAKPKGKAANPTTPAALTARRPVPGGGIAANAATLAYAVAAMILTSRLAKVEEKNLRDGWKNWIAPKAGAVEAKARARWRDDPSTRPKKKTYLVIMWSVDFEKTGNWATGPVLLYKSMDFIAAWVSENDLDMRYPPVTMNERHGIDDPPTHQTFWRSVVLVDPAEDARRAAREAREAQRRREWNAFEGRIVGPKGRREFVTGSGGRIPEY